MRWFCDSDVPEDFSASSDCGKYSICKSHDSTYEAWFNSHPPRIVAADCAGLSEAKRMCEQHKTNQR